MFYCNDTDLLRYEPALFREAVFASQKLLHGTGDLDGTTFTISAGSFEDAAIAYGDVITFDAPIDGSFAVMEVVNATTLVVSLLRGQMFPLQGSPPLAIPVGSATGVGFVIRTFMPQVWMVGEMLERSLGIGDFPTQGILTPEAMRRPCALGTLQMIYNTLAAMDGASASLRVQADLYGRLFARALRGMVVEIDTNGDGVRDVCRSPGLASLVRV